MFAHNNDIKLYYKIFKSDPEISKQRIKNDILNNIDRSNVPNYVIDYMHLNYLKMLRVIDE
jgi:hypothetical protein